MGTILIWKVSSLLRLIWYLYSCSKAGRDGTKSQKKKPSNVYVMVGNVDKK
jgi:hypothetical protein